jgi:drug/metabolite transporter (DMT)-like permease
MHWIFLSLLAPVIYAGNSFVDKYVLQNKIKDSRCLSIYSALAALVLGTGVWIAAKTPVVSQKDCLLLLVSGLISLFALSLYFYALTKNHTSYIIALLQTTPLFVLFLSLIFLGQTLNTWQIAGFFLTFIAVIGLSLEKNKGTFKIDRAFLAIMAANFLFAVAAIIMTFTETTEFVPILIYQCWGVALGGFLLFMLVKPIRRVFVESFKRVGRTTFIIMFTNEVFFNIANALTYLAISLGPVTLVSVLGGTQIFYGILFGAIFTGLFQGTFSEDTTRYGMTRKIALSLLLFIGVELIAIESM